MNSSCAWEFSLCPFWINECIVAWIRPVMPCQERMLPSFRSLHHYTRWWSIPQFSCENKEVCTLMHRKFLMGIQSVLTIIYKNQVGGNLVHKHKKIKIWREGRTDTAKHIQISWADFPIRISNVSDKCLVYYWQLDTYILQYFLIFFWKEEKCWLVMKYQLENFSTQHPLSLVKMVLKGNYC